MKKIILTFIAIISFSANAGVMIEPYLGYGMFGSGDTTRNSTNYSHSPGGLTFGGRLGYQFLGFMAGVDYSLSSTTLTTTATGVSDMEDDISRSNLALFVGYNLPIMLRVWGSYFLDASVEGTTTNSSGSAFLRASDSNDLTKATGGTGIALGVGLTSLPLVSLNAEFRSITFADYENKSGTAITDVTEDVNFQEILLSVSLPWEF